MFIFQSYFINQDPQRIRTAYRHEFWATAPRSKDIYPATTLSPIAASFMALTSKASKGTT
jgi:hypothetical protein